MEPGEPLESPHAYRVRLQHGRRHGQEAPKRFWIQQSAGRRREQAGVVLQTGQCRQLGSFFLQERPGPLFEHLRKRDGRCGHPGSGAGERIRLRDPHERQLLRAVQHPQRPVHVRLHAAVYSFDGSTRHAYRELDRAPPDPRRQQPARDERQHRTTEQRRWSQATKEQVSTLAVGLAQWWLQQRLQQQPRRLRQPPAQVRELP
mmetsp:Transcript_47820/g.83727  ORF Transcript_47820/g.83727 Transcript_47820/m.83727 type:complete len:203 (+) Transcript_47820:962-1570(+)